MLSETERKILDVMSKQLLITKAELTRHVGRYDGVDVHIQRLSDMGLVEKIESLGVAFVITQKGIRALKEMGIGQ